MRTWVVANQKGGVGKTTTSVTLAFGLAEAGHRVLLVDLDPHASATQYLGVAVEPPPAGVFEIFTQDAKVAEVMRETSMPNLWLVPAQSALATVERRMVNVPGAGTRLGKALAEAASDFDYAVIDCAPTLGILQVSALAAADQLIVAAQTEPLALPGVAGMRRTQEMIERSRGRPLPMLIVPTLFDKRTRAGVEARAELERRYDGACWDEAVPVDTRLRDASRTGRPVWELDPESRGAFAYRRLLAALLRRDAAAAVIPGVPTSVAPGASLAVPAGS